MGVVKRIRASLPDYSGTQRRPEKLSRPSPGPRDSAGGRRIGEGPATTRWNASQAVAEGRPAVEGGLRRPDTRREAARFALPGGGVGASPRRSSEGRASRRVKTPKSSAEKQPQGSEEPVSLGPRRPEHKRAPPCPLGNLRPALCNISQPRPWATRPGPIRKQPSGSGNSRQDPEAVSAITRECGKPPLALK